MTYFIKSNKNKDSGWNKTQSKTAAR